MNDQRNRAPAACRVSSATHRRPARSRLARAASVWAAALLVAVSAGCGVAVQDEAQPLPSGALPPVGSTPSATPASLETAIHFVSGRQLEPVEEAIRERSAEGVMEALAAGPPVERQAELRTLLPDLLTGQPLLLITTQPVGEQLTVARAEAFAQLPSNDQILLVGQVVLSMAEVGISSVLITDPFGTPSSRTLPDGREVNGPAVPAEYKSLLVR